MLQLTRARNRLTTPATLTLPEIAASGLTVSASGQDSGFLERDTGAKGSEAPNCHQQEFYVSVSAVF